jgi:hypothetical protein
VTHCSEDNRAIDTINGNSTAVLYRITYKDSVANGEYSLKQGSNLRWDYTWKRDGNVVNGKCEGLWTEFHWSTQSDNSGTVSSEYKDGKIISRNGDPVIDGEDGYINYASDSIIDCYLTGDSPWVHME